MSSPEGLIAPHQSSPSQQPKKLYGSTGSELPQGGSRRSKEQSNDMSIENSHEDSSEGNNEVQFQGAGTDQDKAPIGEERQKGHLKAVNPAIMEHQQLESGVNAMISSSQTESIIKSTTQQDTSQLQEPRWQIPPSTLVGHETSMRKIPDVSASLSRTLSDTTSSSAHALSSKELDNNTTASSRNPWEAGRDATEATISGADGEEKSQSEIQSIIDQFNQGGGPGEEEVMSPRLEITSPLLGNPTQHPPRKSSLEPIRSAGSTVEHEAHNPHVQSSSCSDDLSRLHDIQEPNIASERSSLRSFSQSKSARFGSNEITSPRGSVSIHKPSLPEPEPEPDLPFDFHRFLEQLRHRTADPVAKFLRSFLVEFGKKQWMVHEQVKIIGDFLAFITNKMAQCDIWQEVSDAEFDNAKEGMEKLVMNRLYSQTFSPAISPPSNVPKGKGKKKNVEKLLVPGRRGQHQEDIERDEVLAQKVRIYGWVREEHLDITPVGESGRQFLILAQQELLKIKTYRAPRDKVICVLNCCKVIFGLLRNSKSSDTSADSFVPLLIYVVLQANPDHLVSNVQYILRFRNQDKLCGEAGYYLSSLSGAVQFIENLDQTTLTVSDKEFEKNVEAAVSAIAERHKDDIPVNVGYGQLSEKSGLSKPEVTPRHSMEAEQYTLRNSMDSPSGDMTEENAAVTGLLRTIKRPLSSIGRIFSEESTSPQSSANLKVQQISAHPPETPRRLSPAVFQPPRDSNELLRPNGEPQEPRHTTHSAEDSAARQASAETAEAHRLQRAEHRDVVDTLAGMFPDLDRDIIDDVVRMKEGRVGLAVDACLALSS